MSSKLVSLVLILAASATLCFSAAPNCALPTSSPQFAVLCRLSNGTNAPLPAFQNLTADQVCDGDCRCVMGAQRGGKCGTSSVDNQVYCICDYNAPATTSPILSPFCNATSVLNTLVQVLCQVPIIGDVIKETCTADCVCSHGYSATQAHHCTTNNSVPSNNKTYCVCNGAKNL